MKEKEVIGRRETRIEKVTKRISNALKALWNGEYKATGTDRTEQPVVKADVENFEAVIKGIHEREDEYLAAMRTNGNLDEAKRINKTRAVKKQQISRDIAD